MKNKTSSRQAIRQHWGVPDWRDGKLYPKPDELSLNYWRWEFLRRDAEYRKEWEKYNSSKDPFRLAIDDPDCGFDIPYYPAEHEDHWNDVWRIFRKYGLARLINPSISRPQYLRFHFVPFAPDPKDNPQFKGIEHELIPWLLQYPFLAWFEVWKPLEPQIEHYSSLLKKEQAIALDLLAQRSKGQKHKVKSYIKEEMVKVLVEGRSTFGSRTAPSKRNKVTPRERWPTFLRVLDARSVKAASWFKIGEVVLEKREDVSSHARIAHKTAERLWWKIPIERSLDPVIGMEGATRDDSYGIIPPSKDKQSSLYDWLDVLHPRLRSILIPFSPNI